MDMKQGLLQVTVQVGCGLCDIFFPKLSKSRADVHQVVNQMELKTNTEETFMLHNDPTLG